MGCGQSVASSRNCFTRGSSNSRLTSRRLFPDSMEKQNLKLMDALAAMVGSLDRREIFQSVIRAPRTMVDFDA